MAEALAANTPEALTRQWLADIDAAKPLGLSTYQTSAAYKNITLRKL